MAASVAGTQGGCAAPSFHPGMQGHADKQRGIWDGKVWPGLFKSGRERWPSSPRRGLPAWRALPGRHNKGSCFCPGWTHMPVLWQGDKGWCFPSRTPYRVLEERPFEPSGEPGDMLRDVPHIGKPQAWRNPLREAAGSIRTGPCHIHEYGTFWTFEKAEGKRPGCGYPYLLRGKDQHGPQGTGDHKEPYQWRLLPGKVLSEAQGIRGSVPEDPPQQPDTPEVLWCGIYWRPHRRGS